MGHGGNLAYRPEIDGLRAIAVLAVLLANWRWRSGRKALPIGALGLASLRPASFGLCLWLAPSNRRCGTICY